MVAQLLHRDPSTPSAPDMPSTADIPGSVSNELRIITLRRGEDAAAKAN